MTDLDTWRARALEAEARMAELEQSISAGSRRTLLERAEKAEARCAALREAAKVFLDDFLSNKTCMPGALQRAIAASEEK